MLRLLSLISLLLVAGCGGVGAPANSPAAQPTARASGFTDQPCADLIIVAARGQQQSRAKNFGAGTEIRLVATELTKLAQRHGNTSVRLESIDYQSDPPADLSAYDLAVDAGAARLARRLDALESTCRDSRVAVIGFSMGAQVVHEAIADRSTGQIALVAMIADPMRDPVATYRQFSFGTAAPNPGSLGPGPVIGDLATRTISFCASADDVCNHSPGASRTAVDLVHKHFYGKPQHVAAMAAQMAKIARVAR